ncbi:hypothetical protein ACLOJK_027230, partial [Asimina triloba]
WRITDGCCSKEALFDQDREDDAGLPSKMAAGRSLLDGPIVAWMPGRRSTLLDLKEDGGFANHHGCFSPDCDLM